MFIRAVNLKVKFARTVLVTDGFPYVNTKLGQHQL